MIVLRGLECSTTITHADTEKLLTNALHSALLMKIPLLTPTKHKMEPERSIERSWWGSGECTFILPRQNGNQLQRAILLQRC